MNTPSRAWSARANHVQKRLPNEFRYYLRTYMVNEKQGRHFRQPARNRDAAVPSLRRTMSRYLVV